MSTPQLLMIEDDARLAQMVGEYLTQSGFGFTHAADGASGLEQLQQRSPDLVILDLMLPDTDGLEVCRRIRALPNGLAKVSVLMLTAKGDPMDRIVGLELGADDYLPKPFEPRELVARLQAVLRRGGRGGPADATPAVKVGPLEIQWDARATRLHGRPLELTTAEFELLGLLVKNRERVLTRDRILEATRGLDWEAYDRSVDVLVSRLRQKLGDDPRRPVFIKTVRGLGYRFVGGGDD